MKKNPFKLCFVIVSLFAVLQVFGQESADEESGPPEEVIRKLAAMMPEQSFKREATIVSDGRVAPQNVVIHPVQILNADGSALMKTFFFREGDDWVVFDEQGQVFRPN